MSNRYIAHHWFIYVHYIFFAIDAVVSSFHCILAFSSFKKKKTGVQLLHTAVSVSAVQQSQSALFIHTYLFWGFLSHLGHHRALSRVPCAKQQVLISYLFYIQHRMYVNPNLSIHPTLSSPLGIYVFVLYVHVSISPLQIKSFVPFFQIPHICINI